MSDTLPPVVVVDENGNYWRAFDGFYSMCPVSTDNDPIRVAAIYQRVPIHPAPDLLAAARALVEIEESILAIVKPPEPNPLVDAIRALRAAIEEADR